MVASGPLKVHGAAWVPVVIAVVLPAPGGRTVILTALLATEIFLLPEAAGVSEVAVYLRVFTANGWKLLVS